MNVWLVEPYYTGSHQAWADVVFFNSAYHLTAFVEELPRMLKHFLSSALRGAA